MYNEELEQLIDAALADGVLTDKEKQILFKKAESFGVDLDEFEMVLNARALKAQQPVHQAKEKLGNIVTCPACGAHVPGGTAVCPECGHEFRNIEANHSVQKFSDGLQAANDKMKESAGGAILASTFGIRAKKSPIEQYITTFPVPNTSDDLLEFSTMEAKPEFIQEHAYWILFEKCINQSKRSFAKDVRFQPYYEYYDTQKKNGTYEANLTKKILTILGCVFGAILLIVLICILV